ncbi:hypothetical protein FQN49_005099 [Arthroderma sp. PD_2]|nr:hypothetical protein FQN49_005099 [Arthroderma sp. PD_2]
MFARLINAFTSPKNPSVIIVIGKFGGSIDILHLFPETGEIERFSKSFGPPTFRSYGSREKAREQIGTAIIYAGDGESLNSFLDDVETRIRKRWVSSMTSSPSSVESVTQLVEAVLRPAALDAIHEREERRESSTNKTETHSVFLIRITRPNPGKILGEPRSISG